MSEQPAPPSGAVRDNLEFYDQAAAGTNDYWNLMAAPRWRVKTLRDLLRRDAPARIVDLGCGNGALLEAVGSVIPGAALHGIDLAPAQIEMNRRLKPVIHWMVADLTDPSTLFPPDYAGRFEAVLATEIIEHLDRPDVFLKLALQLATPGARLYLTTQSGPVHETEKRVGHIRHFSAAEITTQLVAAGWQPEKVWNVGYPFHDWSKKIANRTPDRVLARFGSGRYGWKERLTCALLRAAFRFNSRRSGYQLFAVARKP
jgi:2-polyprenyl-3-methyl-5-hydroxy-6-metoxy-1,4-benzoquinol methylase